MDQKHIVFLDMNKTASGEAFLKAAKNLDFFITFASFDPHYYVKPGETLETSILSMADRIVTVDTHHDMDALEATLRAVDEEHPIDGLLSSLDLEVLQAAVTANRLGLRGTNPEAVMTCRNKFVMRKMLKEHGIPTPKFMIVENVEQALEAGKCIGYPCVLKPLDHTGSEGVQMITGPEEFRQALRQHHRDPMYWRGIRKNPRLLIEEYLEGPLVSVETVSNGHQAYVLGVSDRKLSDAPYFAELFASFPAEETEGTRAAVEMTLQALEEIGYDFGPAHTELILTKNGPRIVEINPRLVGATVSLIMNEVQGRSIHEEILKLYVGLPTDFQVENRGVGVWQQAVAQTSGYLAELAGVEEVLASPGVMECSVEHGVGDYLLDKPTRNSDAIGHVTVIGATRKEALQRAQDALAKLQVVVTSDKAELNV